MKFNCFPTEFIKQCVESYTKEHGKAPKILCVNERDYMDWFITATINSAKQFNLEVVRGSYLKDGEFDLAMEIKK